MVMKTVLFCLAVAYEQKLEARDGEIESLRQKLAKAKKSPPRPAAAAPKRARTAAHTEAEPGGEAEEEEEEEEEDGEEEAEAEAEQQDAAEAQPAAAGRKSGRPASNAQTEEQKANAAAKQEQRFKGKVYGSLFAMSAAVGGAPGMAAFFVFMLRAALTSKTRVRRSRVFFPNDLHKQILDDDDLFDLFMKESDARRRPAVSAFIHAKLSGVTIAGMDKLRFATLWMPGHVTLAREVREMEEAIEKNWCPSGTVASWGTTRTAEEQARAAEHIPEPDAEEVDAELEAEVAANMQREADPAEEVALDLISQAQALLKAEFPNETDCQRADRWAGGLGPDNTMWENMVYVLAMREGRLLGFEKALVRGDGLETCEFLVAADARGCGIGNAVHEKMLRLFKRRKNLLMVRLDNKRAQKLYMDDWQMPAHVVAKSGDWQGYGVKDEDKDTHMMLEGSGARTLKAVQAMCAKRPLAEGITLHVHATFDVPGIELDHVGVHGWVPEAPPLHADDDPALEDGDEDGRADENEQDDDDGSAGGAPVELAQADDSENEIDGIDGAGLEEDEQAGSKADPAHGSKTLANVITCMHNGTQFSTGPDLLSLTRDSHRRLPMRAPPHALTSSPVRSLAALNTNEVIMPEDAFAYPGQSERNRLRWASWSVTQRIAFKLTCDAARLVHAAKSKAKSTTSILQMLTFGVRSGNWVGAVKHMMAHPQSVSNAFVTWIWFGADDAPNMKAHVVPQMAEARILEKEGAVVDGMSIRAPWNYTRAPADSESATRNGSTYFDPRACPLL